MSGITNPAEEYFKDGLWGYVTTAWKKLVATAGGALHIQFAGQEADVEVKQTTPADLATGGHGWDGSAWRKLPMVWGYSDTVSETLSEADLPANDSNYSGSTGAAGEVRVITNIAMRTDSTTVDHIRVVALVDGVDTGVLEQYDPTSGRFYLEDCHVVLAHNDKLVFYIYNATLNDNYYARYCGYKMKVAE